MGLLKNIGTGINGVINVKKTWRLGYRFPRQSLSGLSAPNKAYLTAINLCGANLSRANLQDAFLWRANLQNANLWGANLQDAGLSRANLQDANLSRANLKNADLIGANLKNADLIGANLSGAIYADSKSNFILQIGLTDSMSTLILKCSTDSCITTFSDDFDPKKAGMILIRNKKDYEKWKNFRQKKSPY
ncbi:pentapeptide repeat-containing protein [Crocosphaera watsonii WH 8501]|uniref:pentapeptide repeat-containing protein n=1 Tax=Crocosphaera watsonii TaxID=263511 RepID=UPI000045EC10|nr:pentapeptide repeat-containing protein [Crocosphaera watsonii]